MTDTTTMAIQFMRTCPTECELLAFRIRGQRDGHWHEEIHQPEYDRAVKRIQERREAQR